MTQKEARKLPHGLYNLYWKTGGVSEAAVGSLFNGQRWFAPTNWISPSVSTKWLLVKYVEHVRDR